MGFIKFLFTTINKAFAGTLIAYLCGKSIAKKYQTPVECGRWEEETMFLAIRLICSGVVGASAGFLINIIIAALIKKSGDITHDHWAWFTALLPLFIPFLVIFLWCLDKNPS